MKWSLTRGEWVCLGALFLLSFLFNQYFIDAKFYRNISNRARDIVDLTLYTFFWLIGYWGLKKNKTWVSKTWNVILIGFLILIIILLLIDWFIYPFSTKQGTLRLGSIKSFLANPITFIIFIFLGKGSKTITTSK